MTHHAVVVAFVLSQALFALAILSSVSSSASIECTGNGAKNDDGSPVDDALVADDVDTPPSSVFHAYDDDRPSISYCASRIVAAVCAGLGALLFLASAAAVLRAQHVQEQDRMEEGMGEGRKERLERWKSVLFLLAWTCILAQVTSVTVGSAMHGCDDYSVEDTDSTTCRGYLAGGFFYGLATLSAGTGALLPLCCCRRNAAPPQAQEDALTGDDGEDHGCTKQHRGRAHVCGIDVDVAIPALAFTVVTTWCMGFTTVAGTNARVACISAEDDDLEAVHIDDFIDDFTPHHSDEYCNGYIAASTIATLSVLCAGISAIVVSRTPGVQDDVVDKLYRGPQGDQARFKQKQRAERRHHHDKLEERRQQDEARRAKESQRKRAHSGGLFHWSPSSSLRKGASPSLFRSPSNTGRKGPGAAHADAADVADAGTAFSVERDTTHMLGADTVIPYSNKALGNVHIHGSEDDLTRALSENAHQDQMGLYRRADDPASAVRGGVPTIADGPSTENLGSDSGPADDYRDGAGSGGGGELVMDDPVELELEQAMEDPFAAVGAPPKTDVSEARLRQQQIQRDELLRRQHCLRSEQAAFDSSHRKQEVLQAPPLSAEDVSCRADAESPPLLEGNALAKTTSAEHLFSNSHAHYGLGDERDAGGYPERKHTGPPPQVGRSAGALTAKTAVVSAVRTRSESHEQGREDNTINDIVLARQQLVSRTSGGTGGIFSSSGTASSLHPEARRALVAWAGWFVTLGFVCATLCAVQATNARQFCDTLHGSHQSDFLKLADLDLNKLCVGNAIASSLTAFTAAMCFGVAYVTAMPMPESWTAVQLYRIRRICFLISWGLFMAAFAAASAGEADYVCASDVDDDVAGYQCSGHLGSLVAGALGGACCLVASAMMVIVEDPAIGESSEDDDDLESGYLTFY